MQFDAAGAIIRRVRWFFCAPGAKLFPAATLFGSSNWGELHGGELGPGEDWRALRTWSNGKTPATLLGKGNFCGPLDWWLNGCPSDAPPLQMSGDTPLCCVQGAARGTLGIKVGLAYSLPCLPASNFPPAWLKIVGTSAWLLNDHEAPGFTSWLIAADAGGVTIFYVQAVGTGPPYCVFGHYYHQTTGQPPLFFPVLGSVFSTVPLVLYFQQRGFGSPVFNPLGYVRFTPPPAADGQIGVMVGLTSRTANRGVLGIMVGLVSRATPEYPGEIGVEVGLESVATARQSAHLGVEVGLESLIVSISAGELGVEVGLASSLEVTYAGVAGLKIGLVSALEVTYAGVVGIKAGTQGVARGRYAGVVGFKAGVSSKDKVKYTAAVGIKAGVSSKEKAKYSASLGVKIGLASTHSDGITQLCCPLIAISQTLHSNGQSGTPFTMTWNAAGGYWAGTDPDIVLGWRLTCVLVGSSHVWQMTTPTIHCTNTPSVTALTCSHPFSVTTHTVVAGGGCLFSGTYNYTIHE